MTTDLTTDSDEPEEAMPIPTVGIPHTPDLSTPDVVPLVLEGCWSILTSDADSLAEQLDRTASVPVLDLWSEFSRWVESTCGPDPEHHAYPDLDACRAAAIEDAEECRQTLTAELAALPVAAQDAVVRAAVAGAALVQLLFESGRIEDQYRQFWGAWWVSMIGERVLGEAEVPDDEELSETPPPPVDELRTRPRVPARSPAPVQPSESPFLTTQPAAAGCPDSPPQRGAGECVTP